MGKAWHRFRAFEAGLALLGAVALAVVGPLRDAFATLPGVMLLAALILFLAPGILLARWFLREYFSGATLLPAAFVISTGGFALLGVPMLVLQSTLEAYLWVSGAAVVVCVLAAALAALLWDRPADAGDGAASAGDRGGCCGYRFSPSWAC